MVTGIWRLNIAGTSNVVNVTQSILHIVKDITTNIIFTPLSSSSSSSSSWVSSDEHPILAGQPEPKLAGKRRSCEALRSKPGWISVEDDGDDDEEEDDDDDDDDNEEEEEEKEIKDIVEDVENILSDIQIDRKRVAGVMADSWVMEEESLN